MLTVFVFDEKESRREDDLPGALKGLDDDAMVWVALRDPSEEEVAAVKEALGLADAQAQALLKPPDYASLVEIDEVDGAKETGCLSVRRLVARTE